MRPQVNLVVRSPRARAFVGGVLGLALIVAGCTATSSSSAPEAQSPGEANAAPSAVEQSNLPAEDGYDLWLRYPTLRNVDRLAEARQVFQQLLGLQSSPTLDAAREELRRGVSGLLGQPFNAPLSPLLSIQEGPLEGGLWLGSLKGSAVLEGTPLAARLSEMPADGYLVQWAHLAGRKTLVVAGNTELGALYGVFALLQYVQQHKPLADIAIADAPHVQLRLLNHWDNLDRTVERGYSGKSLWDWDSLPQVVSPRYLDYARANASLGINGSVLTNVNANAEVLTEPYLEKVQAIAEVFRPYGIRTYLTARFSAPIEIGGLPTADPLDPAVAQWWADKTAEIYKRIPDFGGYLVKANSEGQPGPQDYKRSHAEGANMLASAVAPFGGVVMWRAFVYSEEVPSDRIRQAYDEFKPLDGSFLPNVLVQPKNGALDFQPREPFHPLLGAMPKTPLALELQITKEYLGQDTHLAYLGPMYEEVLQADTHAAGLGSTVAKVVDGSLHGHSRTAIAGVANIGSDRNWSGSHFNQANWFVYGRMAWDPNFSARKAAEQWVGLTFTPDEATVKVVADLMMQSHQTLVDYMTPLGLVHIMAAGHHYGPGPWVDTLGRPDWNSVYYHRADTGGLGFNRTKTGSAATEQYFPAVRDLFENRETVPDAYLLFFHRVGWQETMKSGRSLWHELVHRYSLGVAAARAQAAQWQQVRLQVDVKRFDEIAEFLNIQAKEAQWWRDANLRYFEQFSRQRIPEQYEQPLHPLSHYRNLPCPADRDRPRCPAVYQ